MRDPRIDRAVGICKKLVSSFSYSWRRKKELAQAQKELKLPEHALKTECPHKVGIKAGNDSKSPGAAEGHHSSLVH